MKNQAALIDRKRLPATLLTGSALQHVAVRSMADHATPVGTRDGTQTPNLGHDFSQVPARTESAACTVTPTRCPFGGACHACPLPLQAKLAVNRPGDRYEQEADQAAEQIMYMPEPRLQCQVEQEGEEEEERTLKTKPLTGQITPLVQRQAELEDEEEEKEILQPKGRTGQTLKVTPGLESRIQCIRGGGQPLPESIRAFFEPRFGHDFSQVRVHDDARAAQLAQSVHAHAFTVEGDVMFGAGQYMPETPVGNRLLAHELTHTIQQGATRPTESSLNFGGRRTQTATAPAISCKGKDMIQRSPDDDDAPTSPRPGAPATSAATTAASSCGVANSCSADRCTEIRDALTEARSLVARAKRDLRPEGGGALGEQTRRALLWHFRTESSNAIQRIRNNFDQIEARLRGGLAIFTCSDPDRHCYLPIPILSIIPQVVAYAYSNTAHPIALCPPFFWAGTWSQAVTIIHEAGHNIGLPRAPFEREVYVSGHEYRALSAEEALVTTDAYANFARDNRYGIPVRVSAPSPEMRTGVAFTGGRPQFMLSYGFSAELRHPALSIINPVAGIEFTYIPATGDSSERAIGSATIGARIAARGQRAYFDLRAGAFYGRESRLRSLGGILTEASGHFQPGRFDISLFWQNYHSLIEGVEDTMVFGIAGGLSF